MSSFNNVRKKVSLHERLSLLAETSKSTAFKIRHNNFSVPTSQMLTKVRESLLASSEKIILRSSQVEKLSVEPKASPSDSTVECELHDYPPSVKTVLEFPSVTSTRNSRILR